MLGLEQKGVTSRRDVGADDGQPMQGDILEVIGHETQEALVGADKTRMHLRLVLHPRTQGRRDVLELLVHDETFDEDVARLLGRQVGELVIELDWLDDLLGQKRGCLDLQQRGRDDEEVTRDIEIEVLHAFDLGKILIGDVGDGDRPDVDLLTRDEREQQVKWSLICIYADAI